VKEISLLSPTDVSGNENDVILTSTAGFNASIVLEV
jgi:hypothetical protein